MDRSSMRTCLIDLRLRLLDGLPLLSGKQRWVRLPWASLNVKASTGPRSEGILMTSRS